ncbi:unnamed protein product [Absidia cylindrospora]
MTLYKKYPRSKMKGFPHACCFPCRGKLDRDDAAMGLLGLKSEADYQEFRIIKPTNEIHASECYI